MLIGEVLIILDGIDDCEPNMYGHAEYPERGAFADPPTGGQITVI
jgi:hypothetical protein